MWDLIVSVPDHCLSFYFVSFATAKTLIADLTRQWAHPLYCRLCYAPSQCGNLPEQKFTWSVCKFQKPFW